MTNTAPASFPKSVTLHKPSRMRDAPTVGASSTRSSHLRFALVATDLAASALAWLIAFRARAAVGTSPQRLSLVAAIAGATVCLLASQELYLGRVCRLRGVEFRRLARVSVLVALAVGVVLRELPAVVVAQGAVLSFLALGGGRTVYASWLRHERRRGRFNRPVLIVGDNEEGLGLERLFAGHPELGFVAVGVVGPDEVTSSLATYHADSVVLAATALEGTVLNKLTRELVDSGVHVHLSAGLTSIAHNRLRPTPMAHEPIFYVEPGKNSPWQEAVRRTFDVVGAALALLLTVPILLAAAVAIKLEDRGPVLFRQQRIGRGGRPFTLYKLRTMVPSAEGLLPLLQDVNQRTGPLFKADRDPRVTRVGHFLRAASIDELPQLFNVLLGTMSLVGPRPALASEVAQFDDELLSRHDIRPGITGLWQVEGRNDASFDSYRTLDLFYLRNRTLRLDLGILSATVAALVAHAVRDLRCNSPKRSYLSIRSVASLPGGGSSAHARRR